MAGEARFRLLADAAPTMLWTTGEGSGATFFNRAWLQFTGRALQQELGQGWLTGVRPEDRERCLATYDAAATAGESFAVEYQLRRADGEYRWIHDRGAPVYEEPHVLAGYIGSCQDVTDQMETEASLRRQTARLQALADASQAFAAHHQHPPLLMDTVARRICEAIGEYATISLVSEDGEWLDVLANYHADPAVMALYRELQPQSRLRVGEGITGRVVQAAEPARLQNLDQSTLRHLVSPQHRAFVERFPLHSLMCVPLRAEGRVIGAITVAQGPHGRPYTEDDQAFLSDLADRAALAIANARLYQVAQQVLKTREEFFAVAAHELRTPVTSIRGFTQLELRRWERTEQLDLPRARHAMQTIDRQSRRLAALVSRLFDIARLEQGQLAMEPAETDLVGIVADAVEGMRLATSGHEIHLQAPPTLTAWVDGLRFGQVVTNVVENAVKFSPPDGSVDVSLEALDQDTVRLEVRDRGAGVSPERRQRLFERHAPEEAAALEQSAGITAGLGLGLIISRQIVEQHGGRITAEFPADGGTRIVVTLPRRPA
ncbi:MAG: ATP-binding protein [Chloroflexota bacterium]|nr:ATP-binding protein [Chloroflexota bacterium]